MCWLTLALKNKVSGKQNYRLLTLAHVTIFGRVYIENMVMEVDILVYIRIYMSNYVELRCSVAPKMYCDHAKNVVTPIFEV